MHTEPIRPSLGIPPGSGRLQTGSARPSSGISSPCLQICGYCRAEAYRGPAMARQTERGPKGRHGTEQDLETEEDDRSEPGIWTRERVARFLKSLIRNSTHQLRRARWLLRLSEARLIWTAGRDAPVKHVAEVHKARVTFPDLFEAALKAPASPMWIRI